MPSNTIYSPREIYIVWEFYNDHDDVIKWKPFSALLVICVGNSKVPGEFPAQRPVTRSFDVFFDLRLNKQSWGWWFETLPRSLWRHCNVLCAFSKQSAILKFILKIEANWAAELYNVYPDASDRVQLVYANDGLCSSNHYCEAPGPISGFHTCRKDKYSSLIIGDKIFIVTTAYADGHYDSVPNAQWYEDLAWCQLQTFWPGR